MMAAEEEEEEKKKAQHQQERRCEEEERSRPGTGAGAGAGASSSHGTSAGASPDSAAHGDASDDASGSGGGDKGAATRTTTTTTTTREESATVATPAAPAAATERPQHGTTSDDGTETAASKSASKKAQASARERARGRWKLLRRAIVSSSSSSSKQQPAVGVASADAVDDDGRGASIRSFGGYGLIPPPSVVTCCRCCCSDTRAPPPAPADGSDCCAAGGCLVENLKRVAVDVDGFGGGDAAATAIATRVEEKLVPSLAALEALMPAGGADAAFDFEVTVAPPPPPPEASSSSSASVSALLAKLLGERNPGLRGRVVVSVESMSSDSGVSGTETQAFRLRVIPQKHCCHSIHLYDLSSLCRRRRRGRSSPPSSPSCPAGAGRQLHPPPPLRLLVRERTSFAPTLEELTSHRGQGRVDNTGNVCVWDCEKVLTWAIIRELCRQREGDSVVRNLAGGSGDRVVVTELGSGMAGLSALALGCCLASSSSSSALVEVYLTDGHADCVRNNRVNVRLMEAAGFLPGSCSAFCRQLLWSCDGVDDGEASCGNSCEVTSRPPPPADVTLVSDCTHFQEYHAGLLWTMVRCAKVGGEIYMCQPNRGASLRRFMDLVAAVNNRNGDDAGNHLVRVEERSYALLDEKHEQLLRLQRNDGAADGEAQSSPPNNGSNYYRPDVHRPRVFVLRKLRDATEDDRLRALRHVEERGS